MSDVTNQTGAEKSLRRIPFSKEDEKTILAMCLGMRVAAVANIIAAVVSAVVSLKAGNVEAGIGVLLQAAFAVFLFQAAKNFQAVAETDTDDQKHIAEGLAQLRVMFLVKGVLVVIGLVIMVLVVPFMILAGGMSAAFS